MASDVCEALYEATASYDLPLPEGELCCWTHFFDACTPASNKNNRGDIEGLFKALEKFELFALDVSSDPSHFFSHVGTLPEYLSLFTGMGKKLLGSILRGETVCPPTSLVEYSNLFDCTIGDHAIVSGGGRFRASFPGSHSDTRVTFQQRRQGRVCPFPVPIKRGHEGRVCHQKCH